jgi:myosin heavy subunit
MQGPSDKPELRGLTWKSLAHIFDTIENSTDGTEYFVRVAMFEIYKEQVRELVYQPGKHLEVREGKKGGFYVKDLQCTPVTNIDTVKKIIIAGNKNRATGATEMNSQSSRSHLILTVIVETQDVTGHVKVGKLNLVDLAGSERISKTKATANRMDEGIEINLSLTALGNVIAALASQRKSGHIPYRDSKLTKLLQDSLGGNTKTVMVANISPASDNKEETMSTLRYANRVKMIQNDPVVNEDPKDAMMNSLRDQIKALEQQLQNSKGGTIVAPNGTTIIQSSQSSVDEERLKKLMEENEQEKQRLIESMKNQSEEETKKLMEQQEKLQQDREKIESELKQRHDLLEKERKEREKLEARLRAMKNNVVKGKQQLLNANKEQAQKIQKQKEELELKRQQELKLKREMSEQLDERLALEEKFSSVQEEASVKTKKLKKLWSQYQMTAQAMEDVQVEFQEEREEYLFTIRSMEKDMKLMLKIIDNFIPLEEVEKIKNRALWDEVEDDFIIQSAILAGNNVSRPETSSSLNQNVLELHPDVPDRFTEPYEQEEYYYEDNTPLYNNTGLYSYSDVYSSEDSVPAAQVYDPSSQKRSSSRASSARRPKTAKKRSS